MEDYDKQTWILLGIGNTMSSLSPGCWFMEEITRNDSLTELQELVDSFENDPPRFYGNCPCQWYKIIRNTENGR